MLENQKSYPFLINLQLHAEGDPAPATPSEPVPAPNEGQAPDTQIGENDMTREDFIVTSSFLKQFQASQGEPPATEPDSAAQEPEKKEDASTTDNPPAADDHSTPESAPNNDEPPVADAVKLPDGRELTFEQITELEKGSMMQKDYTQKTQALAEEKRAFQQEMQTFNTYKEQADPALQLYQALERDPIATLNYLSDYYEKQGVVEPKTPEQLALEDRERALQAKEQELTQTEASNAQRQQMEQFNRYMDDTAAKHKDEGFERDKVIDYMMKNGVYNAEAAWKAMMHDDAVGNLQKQIDELSKKVETARQDGVAEYLKNKAVKSNTAPPVGATNTSGAPPVQIKKPITLRDAKLSALARMSNM